MSDSIGGKRLVLIVCTGNSCRSQMAEGFLRTYHGDRFDVHSAGTQPAEQVHPLAVRVMSEAGIDISGQRPKDIKDFLGRQPVRHLIIVCDRASATCPRIWPGTLSRSELPFDDPADFQGDATQTLNKFREVRDQIDAAMREWEPAPLGAACV